MAAKKGKETDASKQKKEKYKKFCLAFRRNGGNATEAAKAAGYSEKTAYSQGSRLLKNVEVQAMLADMADDAVRKGIITVEKRQRILSDIALDENAEDGDRIRSIDVLNKMDGLYITKVEANIIGGLSMKLKERNKR